MPRVRATSASSDPDPSWVIQYTEEEGGAYKYLYTVEPTRDFNNLYRKPNVMVLRLFKLTEQHRRVPVIAWERV